MLRTLGRRVLMRPKRRAAQREAEAQPQGRMVWTPHDVADAEGPAYNVRCYLERRPIRELLAANTVGRMGRGVEVGCGYGRLTMVLGEFCDDVVGLEREEGLVAIARSLLPDLRFIETPNLAALPLEDDSVDLAMTFTVLQHMTDDDVRAVLGDIRRILKPGALFLAMEKTDPSSVYGDPNDGTQLLSLGRTVDTFAEWLAPLSLVAQRAGQVEPTYPGFDRVGTYMLFRAPA